MSWFHRHDETLNERLLRDADIGGDEAPSAAVLGDGPSAVAPSDSDAEVPEPLFLASRGLGRFARWSPPKNDIFVTVTAPDLATDGQTFTTLPDGTLLVDESCDADLSPLANAVEKHLNPPYTATAERRAGGVFYIWASPIKVARFEADGDDLELTSVDGARSYSRDGETVEASLAPDALAELGSARARDYVAHATRIDGDFWNTTVDPL